MLDLFTIDKPTVLKKRFYGRRLRVNEVAGRNIEIVDYEVTIGKKSGNRLLCLQIRMSGAPYFFWTEGVKLLDTITKENRLSMPFKTRICWDEAGKYLVFRKPINN